MTTAATVILLAALSAPASGDDDFPDLRLGASLATLAPSPVPAPHGFTGLFTGSLDVGLVQLDGPFDSRFTSALRGRLGLGEGPILYSPVWVPFAPGETGPLVASSFRAFYGADLVGGVRVAAFEPWVSVGIGGATDEDLAQLTLATTKLGVSWHVGAGFAVDASYSLDVGINHGDIMPGWMASSSSLGLGLRLSFAELFD
jgi:hypothetical protein